MEVMEPLSGCAGGGDGGVGESPELEGASAMVVRRLCLRRPDGSNGPTRNKEKGWHNA